jgi:hypothetical protein
MGDRVVWAAERTRVRAHDGASQGQVPGWPSQCSRWGLRGALHLDAM